ncbi:MAG TPA: GNAT family N-acetyltransferase [Motilibacteraceae bacterium]|nr:GNAT family N-acetyltransferase [Motilibacteraceae bacterium]
MSGPLPSPPPDPAPAGPAAGTRVTLAQLSPADVGSRVVVRRRLPEGGFADVLGDLLAWTAPGTPDAELLVRTRRGEVRVPEPEVAGGKKVPPAPLRRGARVAALERAAARGWRGLEEERLGDWLLRAGAGFTGRANSVLVAGDPGMALPEAVQAAARWYRARGLPPRAAVPLGLADETDALLAELGWQARDLTDVLTAPVTASTSAELPAGVELRVWAAPTPAWLARYHYRGGPLPDGAAQVLVRGDAVAFLGLADAGAAPDAPLLAVARAAVSADPAGQGTERWVGVAAVDVAPQARRRGLGRAIVAQALRWGVGQGADAAYLQVLTTNEPAQALYRSMGFTPHHRYHYRWAPGAPPA